MSRANILGVMVTVAVVAFVIGYIVGSSGSEEEEGPLTAEQAAKLPTVAKGIEMCPFKGADPAKVTILEFTEFQ